MLVHRSTCAVLGLLRYRNQGCSDLFVSVRVDKSGNELPNIQIAPKSVALRLLPLAPMVRDSTAAPWLIVEPESKKSAVHSFGPRSIAGAIYVPWALLPNRVGFGDPLAAPGLAPAWDSLAVEAGVTAVELPPPHVESAPAAHVGQGSIRSRIAATGGCP